MMSRSAIGLVDSFLQGYAPCCPIVSAVRFGPVADRIRLNGIAHRFLKRATKLTDLFFKFLAQLGEFFKDLLQDLSVNWLYDVFGET